MTDRLTPEIPETWPRLIREGSDGRRLFQTQPPNSYLEFRRADGSEYSMPCVVTEDKDEIVLLLFQAWFAQLGRVPFHGQQVPPSGPYVLLSDLQATPSTPEERP